jgi:CheY-like chemotaxis protein
MPTTAIVDDLVAARAAFFMALDRVDPASLTTPGLVGEWSAREVIAHLGYWAGRAVEVIHAVEDGRIEEVGIDDPPVEEVNATVARVARETPLGTVRTREAASVEALLERLRRMDPSLLDLELPDGLTVEASIREDGPDHYRQHADELQGSFDGVQG